VCGYLRHSSSKSLTRDYLNMAMTLVKDRITTLGPFMLSQTYRTLGECQVKSEDHPLIIKGNIYLAL